MRIEIANLQNHYDINENKIEKIVKKVLNSEKKDARLSIALVDNGEIKKLNKRFLDSNEITDVIAFPLSDNRNILNGEIIVSVERALEVSNKIKSNVEGEIILYIVHGILHLLGFDDYDERDAKIMHEKEAKILAFLGYKVPKVENGFL